jgi:hypothetical protein
MVSVPNIVYERTTNINCPLDIFEDIWNNLALFYTGGHFNTTVLLLYPKTIDTINLEASHLDPEFSVNIAAAIQSFRFERSDMEGFAIVHEINIEERGAEQFALYISDLANGLVLFYRHKDLPNIKVRIAYARIGQTEFAVYPPKDIIAPNDGIVSSLSFDLNSLLQ